MGITLAQAIGFAQAAGFRGEQVVTIVAISLCECGSQACGCNYDCCPPGESCGVLQFYQPGGNRGCALDPACAYRLAYSFWQRRGFQPWSTFNSGCWLSRAPAVRAAMLAVGAPPPPAPITPPPAPGWAWALLGGGLAISAYALRGGRPRAS